MCDIYCFESECNRIISDNSKEHLWHSAIWALDYITSIKSKDKLKIKAKKKTKKKKTS